MNEWSKNTIRSYAQHHNKWLTAFGYKPLDGNAMITDLSPRMPIEYSIREFAEMCRDYLGRHIER